MLQIFVKPIIGGHILDKYMCSIDRSYGSYQALKDYMSLPNYYRLKQEFEIVNKHKEPGYNDQVIHDVALLVIHKGKILLSKKNIAPGFRAMVITCRKYC